MKILGWAFLLVWGAWLVGLVWLAGEWIHAWFTAAPAYLLAISLIWFFGVGAFLWFLFGMLLVASGSFCATAVEADEGQRRAA